MPGRVRCAQHGNMIGVMLYPDDKPYLRCHGNDRLRLASSTCSAVLATTVEQAVSEMFVEQLTLDEDDVRNLAHLAARRGDAHEDEAASLQRDLSEQHQRYARAKRLALAAGDEVLANDFFEEARHARQATLELEQQLATLSERTSLHLGLGKSGMDGHDRRADPVDLLGVATRCAITSAHPCITKALLGRIDRRRMGLLLRWQGGAESRRELVSRVGLLTAWSEDEERALRAYFHQLTWDALQRMFPTARTMRSSARRRASA